MCGQLRRQSQSRERSRRAKIKQREGDLDCWPRLLSRDPDLRRDVRHYSIDGTRFLLATAHRASFLLLATCCFNFETDMSVFFIFLPIRSCPALISCFSSSAMPVAESVKFPADKKPFCRGCLLHVDGDGTCCRLRLEITSFEFHASHFNSRDLTKQENQRHVFFTSSSKTIKWSSRRRSSRQQTSTRARYTYVRGQPSNTRAA